MITANYPAHFLLGSAEKTIRNHEVVKSE